MMKGSDKNLAKRSAKALGEAAVDHIDQMLKVTPGLGLAYGLAKALMGNAMEMRQYRVIEFMETIIDDPDTFTKNVLESQEFQDGFVNTLQQYLTMRTEQKRKLVQNAFKDFARSIDKPNFQIERFTDTVQKISPSSVATLGFIKTNILPFRELQVRKTMAIQNLGTEKPYEWWFQLNLDQEPISKSLSEWIHEEYSASGEKAKQKYGKGPDRKIDDKKQMELAELEKEQLGKYSAPLHELVYLGICATSTDSRVVWGGNGGTTWTLTDFGYEFIEYIEDQKQGK